MKQVYINRSGPIDSTASTRWMNPQSGIGTGGAWDSSPRAEKMAAGGYLGYLRVERRNTFTGALTSPGGAIIETFRLYVNGVNDPTWVGGTVTIGPSDTDGVAPALDVPVQIGDLVSFSRTVSGGTPGAYIPTISHVFSTTTRNTSQHCGWAGIAGGITQYGAPFAFTNIVAARALQEGTNIVAMAGSVTYHTSEVDIAPGAAKTITITLYKNGVKQDGSGGTANTTITISGASATTGSASFALAVVAGDQLSTEIVTTAGSVSTGWSYGCRFVATDQGDIAVGVPSDNLSHICGAGGPYSATAAYKYNAPHATNTGTPEALVSVGFTGKALDDDDGSAFWSEIGPMYVKLATAPGTAKARHFHIGRNGANTTQQLEVQDPATTGHTGETTVFVHTNVFSFETGETYLPAPDPAPDATAYIWYAFQNFVGQNFWTGDGGTITSIAPTNGPTSGGTAFTITGTSFPTDAASVRVLLRGVEATSVIVVNSTSVTGVSGASITAGLGDVNIIFEYADIVDAEASKAAIWTYNSSSQWFTIDPTTTDTTDPGTGVPAGTPPSNGLIYYYGDTPPGTGWIAAAAPPSPFGWWWSDEAMAGAPMIVTLTDNPRAPRDWTKVSTFATGAADHLGGSVACAFNNKLIYGARDYTVATDSPSIRIFDGQSDRLLTTFPKDAGGAVAEALMTIIAANGTVYVATLDTGGNGGRVFELNVAAATLTPIGAAFSGGEVPYALCFGAGRLWVGTNFGNGQPGRVLFFRPDVDSAYTVDEVFGAALGGVCALAFYNGLLYAGIDNENAFSGEVRVRGTDTVWAQSVAGSGTAAMNGYTQLLVFKGNLYGAYWNSAASVALIRKYDGASWTTVYTGATTTALPCVALFEHRSHIYALIGSAGDDAALIYSLTGAAASWVDLSAFLTPAGTIQSTPAVASIRF